MGGPTNQSSPATLSFSFLSSPLGDIGAKLCGQSDHTLTLMLRCLYKNVFVFNLSLWRCFCFRLFCPCMYSCAGWPRSIKGIVPQSISYRLINNQPHILDSNGVWYSSFWLEGPKNQRNLEILVSKFVPRGFEARRTWGFEAQRHGVSRGDAGVSRGSNTDKTLQ